MAIYPSAESDVIASGEDLQQVCQRIFVAAGMNDDDARLLAQTLVHSDMRGVHSHGVLRMKDYVEKLTVGGVDPLGRPRVRSRNGGAIVVDGGNAMGQIAGTFAMDVAIETAAETGIAFAAVDNSNHCGAMDWYAMRAARAGMIGVCGTNALPTMAPLGGTEKVVGINPIGVAIPGGAQGDFVLDFAFGATAHGKIRVYHQKGLEIPAHWAFDRHGEPTTDAAEALVGLIQPIGGHKGVALGMAIGMLSTLLTQAGYGTESGTMETGARAGRDGQFYCAINIAAFTDLGAFRGRVDEVLSQIRNSAKRADVERLFVPGEIEQMIEQHHTAQGIALPAETIDQIIDLAAGLKVDPGALASLRS